MFHVKHPRFRGFFAWDELGCLARAVGFPVDVFQTNLIDEIHVEENGMPYQEVLKMLDFKLLYKSCHQTSNLHTGGWNTCVFRRCAQILNHKALSFEDIYNARVAYQAYEAGDMKGMVLDQRILMRTLKMCGKTISPMKLMHRIKHSEDTFDEPGRIQLYELIDLILWAHGYEQYIPVETYGHFEMEEELFKLVDFDKLLSHHDEKLARRLDNQFLVDEWNFSKEKLAKKGKFKDSTVICGESRVQMARHQKKNYRSLKNTLGDSQKMVYCCKNGFVRERPKTAPEMSNHSPEQTMQGRKMSAAAHNAILHKMQRLLKYSDCKQPREKTFQVDLTDKPSPKEIKRSETPKIVSKDELVNTAKRYERLMFDIETEEGRHELDKLVEMDHYIPKYLDKRDEPEQPRPESHMGSVRTPVRTPAKKSASPKRRPQTGETINALAYPVARIPPAHGKKCDARFRGWYNIRSRKGQHYVLVSPYFQKSPKGGLFQKLASDSSTEVKQVHGKFVHRHTGSSQLSQRPVTAPAVMSIAENQAILKRNVSRFQASSSGYASMDDNEEDDHDGSEHSEEETEDEDDDEEQEEAKPSEDTVEVQEKESPDHSQDEQFLGSLESIETTVSDKLKLLASYQEPPHVTDNRPRAKSAFTRNVALERTIEPFEAKNDDKERYGRSKSAAGDYIAKLGEGVPTPYMDHSKPRVVAVGSMGKITLLENISEARYWEDISKQEKIAEQEENQKNQNEDTPEEKENNNETSEEQKDEKDEPPQQISKPTKKIEEEEEEEEDIAEQIKKEDHLRRQKLANRSYTYMSTALAKLKHQQPRAKSQRGTSARSSTSHKSNNEGKCHSKELSLDINHQTKEKISTDIKKEPSYPLSKSKIESRPMTKDAITPISPDRKGVDSPKKSVTLKESQRRDKKDTNKLQRNNKYEGFLSRMGEDMPPFIRKKMIVA